MADEANGAPHDVRQTNCCVVGGGPAGLMLAYLLARRGVPVTLLESHKDFDRDFRGDTVHPSTQDVLDQIGLYEGLKKVPHGEMRQLRIVTPQGKTLMADLSRLGGKYDYVMMLPQAQFLDYVAAEGQNRFPHLQIVMGANVQRLVQEGGATRGVLYRGADNAWHEVRAPLTVAADGRFSKVRSLAGLEADKIAAPMDVLWFRLPRQADDPHEEGTFNVAHGHIAILLDRGDEWQIGYVILKGSVQQARGAGLDELRQSLVGMIPFLADRVELLQDWKQVAVLSVELGRLKTWHRPGLLFIGDAAHIMSPAGGVGINYAIQDAVEAANVLAEPLKSGQVTEEHLAEVQRRCEPEVARMQTIQKFMHENIVRAALKGGAFRLPLFLRVLLRLPYLRDLPARMIAFGRLRGRVRVEG